MFSNKLLVGAALAVFATQSIGPTYAATVYDYYAPRQASDPVIVNRYVPVQSQVRTYSAVMPTTYATPTYATQTYSALSPRMVAAPRRANPLGRAVGGAAVGAGLGAIGGVIYGAMSRNTGVGRGALTGTAIGAAVGGGLGLLNSLMAPRSNSIANTGYYY